jgi:transposase
MRYVGIDAHKDFAYVVELCENGNEVGYRVELNEDGVAGFLKRLGPDVEAVLEASTNSFTLYDLMAPYVGRVVVAHAAQTRGASSHHVKTDRKDARVLAKLLKAGFVKSVWVPNADQRSLRNLVEFRVELSKQRAATINRLRALFRQEMLKPQVSDLFHGKGRQFVETMAWAVPLHGTLAKSLLGLYSGLDIELQQVELALTELSRQSRDMQLLMTIPGIGPVLAAQIVSQIGDINRFESPGKLAAYAGLVPRVVQTGKTSFTAGISRHSRTLLRSSLCQAVFHAARRPGRLQQFYQKVRQRRPAGVTQIACAHKLLTAIWHMLKCGEPYQDQDTALTARKWKAIGLSSQVCP